MTGDRLAFLDGFTTKFFTGRRGAEGQRAPAPRTRRDIAELASPKGTLDCITAFGRTDFRADLEKIDVPTLVIHGDSDAIVPIEVSGRRTADTVADAKLVVIEGGPHGVNASHAEEFNAALLEFVKSA